jgi:hypothetical protein
MSNSILICANLLPIGTYLCVLGLLHATRRPLVTTGVRDFVALALALAGLAVTPSIDYLMHGHVPARSIIDIRWVSLWLYLVLIAALAPRSFETLVIYNCSELTAIAAIRSIFERMGLRAQEVPGGWMLSDQGMSLEIDNFPALRNVSLHFRGMRDRAMYWRLYDELAGSLALTHTGRSYAGFLLAAAGGMILAFPVWVLARDSEALATLFR